MIEIIILISSICPQNLTVPCYEKMEIVRHENSFDIVSSTKQSHCEAYGHSWEWVYGHSGFFPHSIATTMHCKICHIERKIKKIEHKREVTDIEEKWEDDDTTVDRPVSNNLLNIVPTSY